MTLQMNQKHQKHQEHQEQAKSEDNLALDKQWAELAEDWQNQPYQKTDINKLIKQTRRRVFTAKCCVALDIIGTIVIVIAFFIMLFSEDEELATLYYLGFGGIASIAFCIHTVRFRIQGWRQLSDTPDKAIVNAIANCQSSIKYAQVCKFSCYGLLPAVNWYLYEIAHTHDKALWPSLVFINVFVAALWGVSHYFLRKRQNELKQLKGFL
ncbi:hypothetical protein ACOYR1_14750 [Thalassotalea piscium]